MIERREVRVADSFFAELEAQLGSQRGPNGQPSVTDFIVIDLPVEAERFAASFDELPEAIAGVPSIRMCIGSAALVDAYVVHGIETPDGAVNLVGIEIDL